MAKRRESGFDVVASMPWPISIALGFIAFVAIQYGIGWLWGSSDNPFLAGFAKVASAGVYAPFAWLVLLACCAASCAAFLGRRRRRHLLASQTGMESLRNMGWQSFEVLVGEAFRRQGYTVMETGLGGADGGKDLVLHKDGMKTIVQCKQWRTQKVPVQVVREMFAVMMDERACAVKIVTLCGYTPDAAAFARNKPIELIDGGALLSAVRAIQATREPEGPLDNPWLFAAGLVVCLLLALALPTQRQPNAGEVMRSPASPVVRLPAASPMPLAAQPTFTPTAMKTVAQPSRKVYKAEPPMSAEELREWERRNREAMKILEKTTPEVEAPPAH